MDNKDTVELHTGCQIVGFGPACASLLIAADRLGMLNRLLDRGLIIHESAAGLAPLLKTGINYDIPSNSDALDFLSGISPSGLFSSVLTQPAAQMIKAAGDNAVSLQLVALLIDDIRRCYVQLLPHYPNSHIVFNSKVESINQHDENWKVCTENTRRSAEDRPSFSAKSNIISAYVIISTGSQPYIPAELRAFCARQNIQLLHSEAMLRATHFTTEKPHSAKPIAIVGASHSGFSVLHRLLNQQTGATQKIKMIHRSPIHRMHLCTESATEAGEVFDAEQDICPESGRVFRFQGLYKRSKRLYEDVAQQHYPFVSLHQCADNQETEKQLEGASCVIAATGYSPLIPVIRDACQQDIAVAQQGSALSLNAQANLCSTLGVALQGLMAIGLGYGRKHNGIGEPSYSGAPVGINIFQGADSEAICQQLNAIQPLFCEKRNEKELV